MALEMLPTEELTAGTTKAAEFWGDKSNKDAQQILKATQDAQKLHAEALKKDPNAQPKKVVAFMVSNVTEANTWKLRITSQLRRYLSDTNSDTGIRQFKITPVGDKRKVSFVPAVKRNYEKNGQ